MAGLEMSGVPDAFHAMLETMNVVRGSSASAKATVTLLFTRKRSRTRHRRNPEELDVDPCQRSPSGSTLGVLD
eukprot:6473655-Amphidinium_carterae.3